MYHFIVHRAILCYCTLRGANLLRFSSLFFFSYENDKCILNIIIVQRMVKEKTIRNKRFHSEYMGFERRHTLITSDTVKRYFAFYRELTKYYGYMFMWGEGDYW